MADTTRSSHRWRFFRAGGVDQVRLDRGEDIVHLDELDQKLWVALSCPVKGLEFDERTLAILDLDLDGRVRAPEIITAVRWVDACLKSPEGLVKGVDGLPLSEIDGSTPEGKKVLASATHLLEGLGKAGTGVVTVADATRTADLFQMAKLNGDGIVPPESVDDPAARKVATEILECLGSVLDRSGKPGFDAAKVAAFFEACTALAAWGQKAEDARKDVLPFGDATHDAAAAYEAVHAKIDDWFARCRLAAYDPRSLAALNRKDDVYAELATGMLSASSIETAALPIALVEPGKPLPLGAGVNPAWTASTARLRDLVVAPLLGKDKTSITEADWAKVGAALAPFRAWHGSKAGAVVEKLGLPRVREILASGAKALLEKAVADDLAAAPRVAAIADVEKLARCWRDLHKLVNNFVNFSDFYGRKKAVFQSGTLYLDGRSIDLCVHVNDPGKHAQLAVMAKSYLAYVDCTRPSGEKMQIAAAITAGDSDNLFVGRNGLFYDRKGRDWDATISKIVDNPISIGQAFWAPYKKLLRWIEEQVAKRAAAADDQASLHLQASAAGATGAPPPPAAPKKLDIGIVAALGVAVGGITAALGGLLNALFGLGFFMPLGFLGAVLLISGPSMLIAWLKLRRRNLGPILDANGWAVNTLTRINLPLGRSLTDVAKLPAGAERSLVDPFAEKKPKWPKVLLFLVILGVLLFGFWKTAYPSKWVGERYVPRPANPWRFFGDAYPPAPECAPATTPTPATAPAPVK
jgi:hypothetical protein